MYSRIVVPLDGSSNAELALPPAERMAHAFHAPLLLVNVIDVAQLTWYSQYGMALELTSARDEIMRETAIRSAYLDGIAGDVRNAGLAVSAETRTGRVAREIVDVTRPGDLIVMASHGRSGVRRWLMGSVAEELLRHAPVPILLIKASVPDTAAAPEPIRAPAYGSAAAG